MRILFVAHQFFPEHYAGVEIITLGLAKEFRRRGHETFVLAPKRSRPINEIDPGEIEDYDFEGVPVRRIGRPTEGFGRPYRLDFENEFMEERAREYVREVEPDVIHAEHFQGLSASVIPVLKETGVPLVYTATDFWTMCPVVDFRRHDGVMCTGPDLPNCMKCIMSRYPQSRTKAAINRAPNAALRVLGEVASTPLGNASHQMRQIRDLGERAPYIRREMENVDHIVVYTHLMERLLLENGIGEGKTNISHYGIDTSLITRDDAEREARENDGGTLRIGFIGTLAPHKGCDILIDAVRRMPDADVTLDIYGNLERFQSFIAKMRRKAGDDERINFRGPFQRETVGEVLASLDTLVVPSRWYENQPGVILEGFASGMPVVATNLGGMSEFVHHDENGLLFALDNPGDLAKQLTRLIEEPGLRKKLREGIGPVKTVADDVDELQELYEALISEKTGKERR